MANSERIDDIISDKAFEQLDQLLEKLGSAQDSFGKLVKSVAQTNAEINKSQSITEFNEAIKEANKGFQALETEQKKVTKARTEATKAEKEAIETAKTKLTVDENAKKLLAEQSGTLEQLIKIQLAHKKTIKDLTAEQKALDKSLADGTVSVEEYNKRTDEIAVSLVQSKQAVTDFNVEIRRAAKESNAVEGSYDALSSRLDRLRGLYRSLTEEERENAEIGGVLLQSIKQTDAELKDLDKSLGVTNRNVGNYKESISEALEETGLFGNQLAFLSKAKQVYSSAVKVATLSTSSFSKVLIASGIGAIVIILGSLIAFLLKSQKGIDLVSKAFAYLNGFLDVFIGGLIKLGEQIINNTLPALKGLADLLLGLATNNYFLITRGFESIKNAVNNINSINLIELAKAANEAGKESLKLRDIEIELEKQIIKSIVSQAKLNKSLEAFNSIADDNTRSFKERQEAAESALVVQQQLSNEGLKIAQKEEEIINRQVQLAIKNNSITRDLEKQQAEATANRIKLESDFTKSVFENSKRQRELKQDLLERDLDILIDGFDNQKTINEKRANDEKISLAERFRILEETKRLSDGSFESQIATIQKFTNENVDANELIGTSDARLLNQKIRNLGLSEIIEGRLLEVIRDRRTAVSDLNELEADLIQKRAEKEKESNEKYIQAKSETFQRESDLTIESIEKREAEALNLLAVSLAKREITSNEYEQKRLETQRQFTNEIVNQEIEALQKIIDFQKEKGLDTFNLERQLADLRLQLQKETTAGILEDEKKLFDQEKKIQDARKELLKEVANLAGTIVTAQFDRQFEALNKSSEAIDLNKEKELDRINSSVIGEEEKALRISSLEKKSEIEKEAIDSRRRQLQRKQAIFEKAQAVSRIIAATAQAIIVQLAGAPFFPISGPLIPIIAGIGAAQAATVLAQKIPAFAKGTKYSPEGLAIVGEEGTEMIKDPSGKISFTGDGAELTYLKKGSQVVPHKEVLKMMQSEGGAWDAMISENRRGTSELKKAIQNRPEKSLNITKSGVFYLYKNGSKTVKYLNKLL
jgi:hypothetical protein